MNRRRRTKRRRKRGRNFGILLKLLSMLAICVVVVLALTLFFRVDTIEVSGMERYSRQNILDAAGIKIGDNLFLMNKYGVENHIRTCLPYLEEVHINRKLPDTLVIQVQECGQPLAVEQKDAEWLVSPKGLFVEQLPPGTAKNYPVIYGCTLVDPEIGGKLTLPEENIVQQNSLLELLAALDEADTIQQVEAIHLQDHTTLRMDYAGRFSVELPYNADYRYKLRYLNRIINETMESNQTGIIQMNLSNGQVRFIED